MTALDWNAYLMTSRPSMIRKISTYLNGKLFEWFAALNITCIGLMILIWPHSVQLSAFKYLINVTVNPTLLGLICMFVGYARLGALVVNGRSSIYGPRIRAYCAGIAAVIWLQFWTSLAVYSYTTLGAPSIGLSNWGFLFFAEIVVAYRAATDVRSIDPRNLR